MLTPLLKKLIHKDALTPDECVNALSLMIAQENPEQSAAFLALMRAKGETVDEIVAFVNALQTQQVSVTVNVPVIDIVGTGGDHANTANISTGASILVASCGVPVLKHGNRAVSSKSGSADVLEALGIQLTQTPEAVAESVHKTQFGFCYATSFHPALMQIKPLRTALKIPTLFNLLGPLLNPGKAPYLLLGVFDPTLQPLMADVLIKLNIQRAMIVHGNGLDELNCLGPCDVIEINQGIKSAYTLDPAAFGFSRCTLDDLRGKDATHNATLIQRVMDQEPSALAETMIFNAAAALYLYGHSTTIPLAIAQVRESIECGHAKATLNKITRTLA